jgi:inorganic triphosphatase YgiF
MNLERQANGSDGGRALALRFAVGVEALPRLRRLALFAGTIPVRRSITSIYYDTPDLALKRRALALRIRKEGRLYLQTIKEEAAAAAGDERRWQTTVPHAVPDLSPPELREWLGDVDLAGLRPVFASRIRRTRRQLRLAPDTVVDVIFDQGLIATPGGNELAVSEIDLDLRDGDVQGLFEIARQLNHAAALRLEPRGLAVRGYALLADPDGNQRATARHRRVELNRALPVEEALALITRRSLNHLLLNAPASRHGDVEGVHQMRVALRRLRVAFNLFKSLIPPAQHAWASGEVKWLSEALGATRNWDVFAELVAPVEEAFAGDPDIALLARRVAEARRTAQAAIAEVLASQRYADFTLELTAWIETRAWRRQAVSETSVRLLSPLSDLADQLLDRRYRAARKLAKRFDELDIDGRHTLRIALKKMRYTADSFARLYDAKPVARYLKRLAALQEDLGVLNDIATADRLIAALPESTDGTEEGDVRRGAALVRGWSAHVAALRCTAIDREVDAFLKAKPFWERPQRPARPALPPQP